jgi:hypothetical protein
MAKENLRIQVYLTEDKVIERLKKDKAKFDEKNFVASSWSQYVTSIITQHVTRTK